MPGYSHWKIPADVTRDFAGLNRLCEEIVVRHHGGRKSESREVAQMTRTQLLEKEQRFTPAMRTMEPYVRGMVRINWFALLNQKYRDNFSSTRAEWERRRILLLKRYTATQEHNLKNRRHGVDLLISKEDAKNNEEQNTKRLAWLRNQAANLLPEELRPVFSVMLTYSGPRQRDEIMKALELPEARDKEELKKSKQQAYNAKYRVEEILKRECPIV